jgi:ferritin-like metal-binding protein YciE
MKIDSLHDLYIHGIQDMRTGCAKTFQGMEAMRDAASHPDGRALVEGGLTAMHGAMDMFDRILERHGVEATETGNKALKALAEEASEWTAGTYADDTLRDLAIVEKTRNIAFYPDAGFTAFRHQAEALGYHDDARELAGDADPSGGGEDQTALIDRVEKTLLGGMPKAA